MWRLIPIAVVALLALLAVPALAADPGNGATQSVETFTEATNWFGPDACTGKTITGVGTQSGTSTITETPNGGVHVLTDIQGSVDLYEANGPGPWDPQPGAFVGTWTYTAHESDQAPPDAQGSTTRITSGPLVFPDGTSAKRELVFHITWDKDPPPLKLIFVRFVCGGGA